MAKNVSFLLCLLIMALDIIAGILGIEAELAQNKLSSRKMLIFECRDPSYGAFKLALSAAVFLIVAHALTNLIGGCVVVWSKEELEQATANKQLAFASLILSWIVLVVAFSMLIMGAMSNTKTRRSCGLGHQRLLSIGGVLCFIHGLFSVAYFVSAKATRKEEKMPKQGGRPV
ncbi:hypothetical protein MLD38_019379 [Melastoma candidum]|uniref:Uncharacterized protein n=1 Tax=Melastoma candidum TaxID=119954 RepID=A0ACB9QWX2_9MYRT|nr:hypothetical protein MLD38_019379 [Melastoma candidum]